MASATQDFKITLPITGYVTRAYKDERGVENNVLVIEGIASDTSKDQYDGKMSSDCIIGMVNTVNDGVGVPVFNKVEKAEKAHVGIDIDHSDHWTDQIGRAVEGRAIYDLTDEMKAAGYQPPLMYVKAEIDLDMSHGRDLKRALDKGTKLGMSIWGYVRDGKVEVNRSTGEKTENFYQVDLRKIAITSRPVNKNTWLTEVRRSMTGVEMEEILSQDAAQMGLMDDDNEVPMSAAAPADGELTDAGLTSAALADLGPAALEAHQEEVARAAGAAKNNSNATTQKVSAQPAAQPSAAPKKIADTNRNTSGTPSAEGTGEETEDDEDLDDKMLDEGAAESATLPGSEDDADGDRDGDTAPPQGEGSVDDADGDRDGDGEDEEGQDGVAPKATVKRDGTGDPSVETRADYVEPPNPSMQQDARKRKPKTGAPTVGRAEGDAEAEETEAGAEEGDEVARGKLSTKARNNLDNSDFADPANDAFPITDEAHVVAAFRDLGFVKDPQRRARIRKRIIAIAHKKGLKVPAGDGGDVQRSEDDSLDAVFDILVDEVAEAVMEIVDLNQPAQELGEVQRAQTEQRDALQGVSPLLQEMGQEIARSQSVIDTLMTTVQTLTAELDTVKTKLQEPMGRKGVVARGEYEGPKPIQLPEQGRTQILEQVKRAYGPAAAANLLLGRLYDPERYPAADGIDVPAEFLDHSDIPA